MPAPNTAHQAASCLIRKKPRAAGRQAVAGTSSVYWRVLGCAEGAEVPPTGRAPPQTWVVLQHQGQEAGLGGAGRGRAGPTPGERRTAACCYQRPTQGGAPWSRAGMSGASTGEALQSGPRRRPQLPPGACLLSPGPGASWGSAARGGTAETGTRAPAPAKLLVSCHSVFRRPSLLEGTVHAQGDTATPFGCHRRAHSRKQQLGCSGANHSFTRHSFTQRISPSPAMHYAMRQARCRVGTPGCPTEPSRQP